MINYCVTWSLRVMQYNWYDESRVSLTLSACESDEWLVNQNDYLALCFYHTVSYLMIVLICMRRVAS
jgi:hypothetical protein